MTIELRCPVCGRKAFEAEGPLPVSVRWKCSRSGCDFIGAPVSSRKAPLHRTYECSRCHRRQHVERPVSDRTHCIVCGTETLVILAETWPGPEPARSPASVERPLSGCQVEVK